MSASSLIRYLLIAQTAALCAGFLNGLHPALDSVSHFRLHLIAATAVVAAVAMATPARRMGLAAAACVAAV
jgi:hypothetical protein